MADDGQKERCHRVDALWGPWVGGCKSDGAKTRWERKAVQRANKESARGSLFSLQLRLAFGRYFGGFLPDWSSWQCLCNNRLSREHSFLLNQSPLSRPVASFSP